MRSRSDVAVSADVAAPPLDAPALAAAPVPPRLALMAFVLPGVRSVRRNWLGIVALQALGLLVVLAYYHLPAIRGWYDALAAAKARGGYAFAAVAMGLASGVLPEIAKYAVGIDRSLGAARWRHTAFNTLMYGCLGMIVDAFYRLLAVVVGDEVTFRNVAIKVMADQFIYTPLLGVGLVALFYTWREHHYRLGRTFAALGTHWYLTRVVILLLPCWAYWIPMTTLMYSLPPSLVFVFGAFASAAASLMLTSIASESAGVGEGKGA